MSAWENYRLEWSPYPLSGLATLNATPYFETGSVSPWTGENNATVAASSAQAHQGSWSMLVTPDGITSTPQAQSEAIPVIAGVSYTLSGWLRAGGAVTRVLGVFWYNEAGSLVSSSTISNALAANTWTQYGPTAYTAPDGAVTARIKTNGAGVASTPWWVDEAVLAADVDDIPRAWLDITSYARAESGPPIPTQAGVPPMGSSAQYATMSVSLDNTDHRFTYGYTGSPLSPNWKPGRQIRCYEVIGSRRFDLFSGYLKAPDTDDWAEQGMDQYVTVTAVDRLGWLGTFRPFISNLAEHIIYTGGSSLVAYYPLLDPSGSSSATAAPPVTRPRLSFFDYRTQTTVPSSALIQFRQGTASLGEDVSPAQFAMALNGSSLAASTALRSSDIGTITVASGQAITVAAWVNLQPGDSALSQYPIDLRGTDISNRYILLRANPSTGNWEFLFNYDGWGTTVTGPPVVYGVPLLVAGQIVFTTGATHSLWVGGVVSTATVGGSAPSSAGYLDLLLGAAYNGFLSHAQIYVSSSSSAYSTTTQLAQYDAGLTGLYGQYAGERVATLAGYAGVPTGQLGLVERGAALMQRASLAGKTPLTAMREAETTEQGRLRTTGSGLIVFDPRTRRYNS